MVEQSSGFEPMISAPAADDRHRSTPTRTALALTDVVAGFRAVDLWRTFAWNDVRARYRRSRIGQFWIAISIAVFIVSVGIFYSQVLGITLDDYLPSLALGYVAWALLATVIADGCGVFVSATAFLTQHRIPLTAFVLRVVNRNIIVFLHNAVVVVIVLVVYPHPVGASLFLLIPAAVIWVVTSFWLVMLLGLFAARFRDVPQIVASIMQISFLLTPVLWRPQDLSGPAATIAKFNPFSHFIELIRQPLLGEAPSATNWVVTITVAAGGLAITFAIFAAVRRRLPYWL